MDFLYHWFFFYWLYIVYIPSLFLGFSSYHRDDDASVTARYDDDGGKLRYKVCFFDDLFLYYRRCQDFYKNLTLCSITPTPPPLPSKWREICKLWDGLKKGGGLVYAMQSNGPQPQVFWRYSWGRCRTQRCRLIFGVRAAPQSKSVMLRSASAPKWQNVRHAWINVNFWAPNVGY